MLNLGHSCGWATNRDGFLILEKTHTGVVYLAGKITFLHNDFMDDYAAEGRHRYFSSNDDPNNQTSRGERRLSFYPNPIVDRQLLICTVCCHPYLDKGEEKMALKAAVPIMVAGSA